LSLTTQAPRFSYGVLDLLFLRSSPYTTLSLRKVCPDKSLDIPTIDDIEDFVKLQPVAIAQKIKNITNKYLAAISAKASFIFPIYPEPPMLKAKKQRGG